MIPWAVSALIVVGGFAVPLVIGVAAGLGAASIGREEDPRWARTQRYAIRAIIGGLALLMVAIVLIKLLVPGA